MELVVSLTIFVILIFAIVLVTRKLMIYNIRKIAIYLRWNNNIVGQLLGYATSTPELISAIVAGSIGMISTSIYNVIFSNIINIISVIVITFIYKRYSSIKHKKFTYDYVIIVLSLIVPIILISADIANNVWSIVALVIIYIIYIAGSKKVDYFASEKEELEIEKESFEIGVKALKRKKIRVDRKKKLIKSVILLLLSIVILYFLGNMLGSILENLGSKFGISEIILGIVLGFVTSIPEMITFMSSYKRHRRYKNGDNDKGAVEVINNLATSNISNLCIVQTVAVICFLLFAK